MMRRAPGRGRLNWLLVFLCAGLAWIAFLEQQQTLNPDSSAPGKDKPVNVSVGRQAPPERFIMPPRDAFAEIVERPLFARDRRPAPPEASAPAADPDSPKLALTGVLISGRESTALMLRLDTREVLRLTVGREIDGWRVDTIDPERVILALGEKTQIYKLEEGVVPPERPQPRRNLRRPGSPANAPQSGASQGDGTSPTKLRKEQ